MAEPRGRTPLPALVCLVALLVLTGLVWWRVLGRDTATTAASKPCVTSTAKTKLPAPADVSVSVLNATTRPGLAASTAAALRSFGFSVPADGVGNDHPAKPITGSAQIRFTADQKAAATLLGFYFPHATLAPLPASSHARLTVALGSGFTALPSAEQITRAMSAANVEIAASPAPADTRC